MTTTTDNPKSRANLGKDFSTTDLTFGDIDGQYPTSNYENASSVNASARAGSSSNELDIAGSVSGIDLSQYLGGIESQYPLNQVIQTESGHIIEYNDSPTSPRILIMHAEGTGIDMRPDGSIIVNAAGGGLVQVSSGGHKLIVKGDGQMSYSGNLTLDVAGDFNVNVGGSYNVQAKDETKSIMGASRDIYFGNKYSTVKGNRRDTYTGDYNGITFGDSGYFVKGNNQVAVQGSFSQSSKGVMSSSSEEQMTSSSPDINIGAENISVFGANGNIGGENVTMHSFNSFIGHSLWAGETVNTKTVTATATVNAISHHGDLYGTATSALESNVAAGSASQVQGSDASFDTTGSSDKATTETIDAYSKSNYGTKKVSIDEGDVYKSNLDKLVSTENVTDRPLVLSQVRAKKRDAGHSASKAFNNYAVTSKQMNPNYIDTIPPAVSEIRDPKQLTQTGQATLPDGDPTARTIPATNRTGTISVDPQYNPNLLQIITTATKITPSVSLSEFAYGKGDPHGLDKTLRLEQKIPILRNLYPHAQALTRIRDNKDEYRGYNLEVTEGLYIPHADETIETDGILDLRKQGRAVVYELVGINGVIDKAKTFELASWMAKNLQYDKIILDYDMYDPFGDLNCQIVLIMPQVPADYKVSYKLETETLYNGKKQDNGFMEIVTEKIEPLDPADSTAPAPESIPDDSEYEPQ